MKEISDLERIGEESSLSYIPRDLFKAIDLTPLVGIFSSFIRSTDESIAGVVDYCSGAPLKRHSIRFVRVLLRNVELCASFAYTFGVVYGAERLYNLINH